MLCPKCQHRNPDDNRFCGNCGCDLTKAAQTIYPREGYDEGELPAVSDVEPDNPRFRRDVPPLPASEYGPVPDAPRSRSLESRRSEEIPISDIPVREIDRTVKTPPEPVHEVKSEPREREDLRSYGSTSGILFNLDPRKPTPLVESREPVRTAPDTVTPRRSEGIHGPSFLGLADPPDTDFLDEIDEPESHSRRNWFLLALVIVIGLAALQWRNIRDTGMNFAGSMKLNLPHKKGEAPKPAETASTDTHSENGPANNGNPEIVVNPENNGADKKPAENVAPSASSGATGNAAAQNGSASTPPTNPGGDQQAATAKNDDVNASKPADKQATEQAKNSATATNSEPKNTGADDSNDETDIAAEPAAKSPAKAAKTKSRAAAAPKAEPASAGAEELARANSAGSPETAAKWLWASTSKGNLDAPVRLADMYATGRGVPKDCEQATVLLNSSARRGNPRASARLGMYYATGQCVAQDRSQAWHWLSVAHQRDPNSDWITQYRQRLWSQMTPDERARAGNGPTANASE